MTLYGKFGNIYLDQVRSLICASDKCTIKFVNDPETYEILNTSSLYEPAKNFADRMEKVKKLEEKKELELSNHAERINELMAQESVSIFDKRDLFRKQSHSS